MADPGMKRTLGFGGAIKRGDEGGGCVVDS